MHIAFQFGRTIELARQELTFTAGSLPFQWSLFSVQGKFGVLKPEGDWQQRSLVEAGLQSDMYRELQMCLDDLQARLGGTVRIVCLEKQVGRNELAATLKDMALALSSPDRKADIGLSVYATEINAFKTAMQLKKVLRDTGRSIRVVVPKVDELSSAQVFHNKLALSSHSGNVELVVIGQGSQYWVGVTMTVQDIDAYTERDFHLPKPDPVSGMLPPKLAQSMVNIATRGQQDIAVYDPFCGNGRIVLEAAVSGYGAFGSDIEERKVSAARENLAWLIGEKAEPVEEKIWLADATDSQTPHRFREAYPAGDFVIAGEPYLGKPLRAALKPEEVEEWLQDLVKLYDGFFTAWSGLPDYLQPMQMLIVFPRAKVEGGKEAAVYDSLVDTLDRLGYHSDILYCYDRPDSHVRRDLVCISYK